MSSSSIAMKKIGEEEYLNLARIVVFNAKFSQNFKDKRNFKILNVLPLSLIKLRNQQIIFHLFARTDEFKLMLTHTYFSKLNLHNI